MAGNTGSQTPTPVQPGAIAQYLQNGHQPSPPMVTQTIPPTKRRFQWTGFLDKTLWDWLQLLGAVAVPIVVVFVSVWYTNQQSHDLQIARDQQQQATSVALDQQRQTTYDTYLDRMSDLITSQQLRASKPEDEVRALARARTVAALKVLDPVRKGQLLVFLYDAHLIDTNAIVDLRNANLSYAELGGADLNGADLSYANLYGANLEFADLNGADLSYAYLLGADLSYAYLLGANLHGAVPSHANLSYADLYGADLSYADLRGANLSSADLRGANLSSALDFTDQQLKTAISLQGTIMPNGSKHP